MLHNERRAKKMMTSTKLFPLVAAICISFLSVACACASNSTSSHPSSSSSLLTKPPQWREHLILVDSSSHVGLGLNTVAAWLLSFLAASVSSAGGVGGGSLFLPILNLVAGLSLKRATAYSSFMVTGGATSNVLYNLLCTGGGGRRAAAAAVIDYDIALLFQPCLLLGVSIGVVSNVMFPEWFITALFALFLAFCIAKTCRAGLRIWSSESRGAILAAATDAATAHGRDEPLLLPHGTDAIAGNGGGARGDAGFPWKDVLVLVTVWLCFFVLHVFIGDKHGKGMIRIEPCGVAYWLITLSQVPFAVAFTAYIIYAKRKKQVLHNQEDGKANPESTKMDTLPTLLFPLAAFVTGALSGLFGIGGGVLLNPVLLQIGIPPQTAAATSSFMVLFCASMSMVQFILLGMQGIGEASVYAGICFVASVVGAVVIERVIRKSGRVSLIVFLVTGIMAVSTVIVTFFGALDVWAQYTRGAYMGFKLPC
uniref:Sulfite exporter TauE/SafE family protein n=1 Tax=Oryza punctata TaxID=4537 RepID=A0A0E0JPN4_ORYPU